MYILKITSFVDGLQSVHVRPVCVFIFMSAFAHCGLFTIGMMMIIEDGNERLTGLSQAN